MKPKQMMLFAVAIGCGLFAMIGAQQILSGNKPVEQEMVKILVAKVDIDPGIPLDKSNVGFQDWPKDNVPEGAITKDEEFAEHALKIKISPKMPVLVAYLGPKGAVGVESLIPKGMTLVTLPVDLTQAHSGLLRPGSSVSVSCAITRPGRDGRENIKIHTVLKRVRVIAVNDKVAGTEATKDPNPAKIENISFVTFPRQAMLLNLAKLVSNGRMQFSMLGEEDKSKEDTQDLDETTLAQRSNELAGEKAAELLGNVPTSAKPVSKDEQRPSGSSFSDYLKQQPMAPEVLDLGKRPSRPTWRIEIWNGEKKDIHEVELPDEPVVIQPSAPESNDQWTAPLLQFFSRKRTAKPTVPGISVDAVGRNEIGTFRRQECGESPKTRRVNEQGQPVLMTNE